MKKLLILIMLTALASFGFAQVSTGMIFNYSAGTYTESATGTVLGIETNDDTSFNALALPFTFTYNGTAFTSFSVNSNGFLALGATVVSSYAALSTGSSNNVVSAIGRDLNGQTGARLTWEILGSAPDRYALVQWKNYRKYNVTGDSYNFQIKLYETSNKIEIVYGTMTNNATATTAQVGLRGATSADYNNRSTTTNWAATTAGALNSATCTLSSTVFPASGTTFAWTISPIYPEPTNHVTGFAAGTLGYTTIQLNWTGAIGAQLPGSYLIQAIRGAGAYAAVADGTPVANDAVWTDNNAAINIAHVVGASTYTFTGLAPNTAYEFKIWPYTNGAANINFKTDGAIPTVNASTLDPTVSTFPWNVDFGTLITDWLPVNWTKYSGVLADPSVLTLAGGSWGQDDWLNITAPLNKAAKLNMYGTAAQGWMVSPPIAMPGAGYQLEFDVAYMAWNGLSTPPVTDGTNDRFEILIGDGTTWTPANVVRSWDNAGGTYSLNNINPAGEHITIDISGYTGTKYIAFYAHNGTIGARDNDLMFDNVLIREIPVGEPEVVTITSPADGATGLPKAGFSINWSPAVTGGAADYYAVYLSMDEGNIYGDVYFETTGTSLNPATYAGGPGSPITFGYGERWYYTVEAVNGSGSAVVEPARRFEIEADPAINVFPYVQTFGGGVFPPTAWSLAPVVGAYNWTYNAAVNGYGAVENMGAARANFYSQSSGSYDLITAPINLDGMAGLLTFDHAYATYSGENDQLEILASSNGVDYTSVNIFDGGTAGPLNTGGTVTATFVPTAAQWATKSVIVPIGTTHVKFRAISAYGNDLYIDNIGLDQTVPIDHDVAVTSLFNMNEVTAPVSVTPKAMVKNWGTNTETFDVSIVIGSYTNTQTVVALAPTATAEVTFSSFVPTVFTAENVVVTSLLATDEVPGNDQISSVLICLPLDVQAYGDVAFDGAGSPGPATFNLSTPGTVTDLPSANPWDGQFLSGADWIDGAWIGSEYYDSLVPTSGNYWQVDPITGAGTVLGPYNTASMSGIAYDEVNGITYATNGTSLYTMSEIGVPTLIGALHLSGGVSWSGLMIGMAYDSFTNVLYGVDLGYDALFTINTADGECTPVGLIGLPLNYAQDCAFDRDNGLLYLAGYTGSGALYWIDTTTGAAYKVGDFQNGAEITGFAIPYTSGTLEAPVVTMVNGEITWEPVAGATHYTIYGSDDPYGTFEFITNLDDAYTSWPIDTEAGYPAAKRFYHVTANDSGARAQRPQIQGLNNLPNEAKALKAKPATGDVFAPRVK